MRKCYKDGPSRFARTHFNRSISLTHRLVGGGGGGLDSTSIFPRSKTAHDHLVNRTIHAPPAREVENAQKPARITSQIVRGNRLILAKNLYYEKGYKTKSHNNTHTHTHTQRKIRHTLASSVADMALRSLRMFWILLKLLSRAIVSAFSFACDSLARSSSTSRVSALASPALRFASYGGGGAGGKGGAAALSVEVRSLCGRCTRSLFVRLLFWRVLGRGVC